jgi:hypothetical protein
MLSVVGGETESSRSVAWKVDVDVQTWREQQAYEQCQIARHRLEAAISVICGSDGEEHSAKLRRVYFESISLIPKLSPVRLPSESAENVELASVCGFCAGQTGSAVVLVPFAEKLANHFFDRHFLDVYVADVACFKQLPARLGDFCAWNFQLH